MPAHGTLTDDSEQPIQASLDPSDGAAPAGSGIPDAVGDRDETSASETDLEAGFGGPALSVAGAARGLGVATATLRSWERRYGLVPSLHTKGGHRRYGPADLARLQVMHRLVREGVPPAEAARAAIRAQLAPDHVRADGPYSAILAAGTPATGSPAAGARPAGTPGTGTPGADRSSVPTSDDASLHGDAPSGGGRVLPLPRRSRSARGLARSAMALDANSCHRTVESSLAAHGAVETWEALVRPVLAAIGERWAQTGRGVEVEHSFSLVVAGALAAHSARLTRPRNDRPVVLASVPDELHDLPLMALQAALVDEGIRSHVIGARTPAEALGDAVVRLGPSAVFLWSQMSPCLPPALPPMRPAPVMLVGGPGWAALPADVVRTADLPQAVAAVRSAMGL